MTLDKLTGTYEKFWVFLCFVKFVSSIAVWKKAHELVNRCELGCFCLFCSWRFHTHGLSLVTGCLPCCHFSLKGALLQEAVGRDGEQNVSSRTEGPQERPRKPEGKRKEGRVTQWWAPLASRTLVRGTAAVLMPQSASHLSLSALSRSVGSHTITLWCFCASPARNIWSSWVRAHFMPALLGAKCCAGCDTAGTAL